MNPSGERASEPTSLDFVLQRILRAIEDVSSVPKVEEEISARFWSVYKAEADEHDAEFLQKYNGDLDIVLIFSGLFSAVSTTFIVGMQPDLNPDPNETTQALLRLVVHSLNNTAFSGQPFDLPVWGGPSENVIWTQSLLYASLGTSVLAAFGAVLGKHWLSYYVRVGYRGTIDARCKERQQRLEGIKQWRLLAVIDVLPLLLQTSLLLFSIGIAAYLYVRQRVVGGIVIGAIALGVLFYTFIVVTSVVSQQCPFRTPVGDALRKLLIMAKARISDTNSWLKLESYGAFSFIQRWPHQEETDPPPLIKLAAFVRRTLGIHNSEPSLLVTRAPPSSALPAFAIPPHPIDSRDALAVSWILETSTDARIIATAAHIVPEIEWPLTMDAFASWLQLMNTFIDCFERGRHAKPQLRPYARDRAMATGKALLHIFFEKNNLLCASGKWAVIYDFVVREEPDSSNITWSFPDALPELSWLNDLHIEDPTDHELRFICGLVRSTFTPRLPRSAQKVDPSTIFKPRIGPVPSTLIPWITHSLLHIIPNRRPFFVAERIAEVLSSLLATSPLPTYDLLADALLGVGLLLGMPVPRDLLVISDKSYLVRTIMANVLGRIQLVLPTEGDICTWDTHSLLALALLEPVFNIREFSDVLLEQYMHVWCVRLCRSMRMRNARFVASATPPIESPYINTNYELRYDAISRLAIRLSVRSVAYYDLSSSPTEPLWAFWHLRRHLYGEPPGSGIGGTGEGHPVVDVEQALAFAEEYQRSAMCANDSERRRVYLLAAGDTLWALSTARNFNLDGILARMVAISSWAMEEPHPLALRDAGLKLLHSICTKSTMFDDDSIFAQLEPLDFFSTLRVHTSTPHPAVSQASNGKHAYGADFDRNAAYLGVVRTIVESQKCDQYLVEYGHIKTCIDMARHLLDQGQAKPLQLSTAADPWHDLFTVLVLYGWAPPDDHLFLRDLFTTASKALPREKFAVVCPIALEPLLEPRIGDDGSRFRTIQLQQRATVVMDWLRFRLSSEGEQGNETIRDMQVVIESLVGSRLGG
ncbi:hypothetical protein HGRIS_010134 [Hohenbuehelia grisea]|uniref:DUF6535 domain-containing protein n=1 Tax=Hohenbuehelia grisea TaxID=104357 RepID=A0ABR3J3R4_9AGAR